MPEEKGLFAVRPSMVLGAGDWSSASGICEGNEDWIDIDVSSPNNPCLDAFEDFTYPWMARKFFINAKELEGTEYDTKPISLSGIRSDSRKRWNEVNTTIGEAEERDRIKKIPADPKRNIATRIKYTDAGKELAKGTEGPFSLIKPSLVVRKKSKSGPTLLVHSRDWPQYLSKRESFCLVFREYASRYLYPGSITFLPDDSICFDGDVWTFRNCDGLFKHRAYLNANAPTLIHNWHIQGGGRPAPRGGRMYCLTVQNVPKKYRKKLLIVGQEAVELDFSQFHPWMLYARHKGICLSKGDGQDVYAWALDEARKMPELHALGDLLTRDLMKPIWQIAMNASGEREAVGAIANELRFILEGEASAIDGQLLNGAGEKQAYKHARMLLDVIKRTNPGIELFTGIGIVLQTIDAFCAQAILTWAMSRNIEIIPIHDSFIVPRQHGQRLGQAMSEVKKALFDWIRKHEFDIQPGRMDLSQYLLKAVDVKA